MDAILQHREQVQLVGERERRVDSLADRVGRVEDLDGVRDVVAVPRVGIVDAGERGRLVVEPTSDDVGVPLPGGPAGNRVVEEDHPLAVVEEPLERLDVAGRRVGELRRRVAAGERDARHVVHHEHVELGGPGGLDEAEGLGLLDVGPLDAVHRVEHGEERRRVERVALGHHGDTTTR